MADQPAPDDDETQPVYGISPLQGLIDEALDRMQEQLFWREWAIMTGPLVRADMRRRGLVTYDPDGTRREPERPSEEG